MRKPSADLKPKTLRAWPTRWEGRTWRCARNAFMPGGAPPPLNEGMLKGIYNACGHPDTKLSLENLNRLVGGLRVYRGLQILRKEGMIVYEKRIWEQTGLWPKRFL